MSFDGLILTVLALLAGLYVGFARGGRIRAFAETDLRSRALLAVGVIVPALADRFTREVAVPLVVIGLACLFAFAILNVRIVGMSVMAIGILANLLTTFLNGGMPVRAEALVRAELATPNEINRVELRGARRLEEPTHRLRFFGDIIPLPETGQVLSFGDLVVLIGLADVMANLTLRRRRVRVGADIGDDEPELLLSDYIPALAPREELVDGVRNPRPAPRIAHVPREEAHETWYATIAADDATFEDAMVDDVADQAPSFDDDVAFVDTAFEAVDYDQFLAVPEPTVAPRVDQHDVPEVGPVVDVIDVRDVTVPTTPTAPAAPVAPVMKMAPVDPAMTVDLSESPPVGPAPTDDAVHDDHPNVDHSATIDLDDDLDDDHDLDVDHDDHDDHADEYSADDAADHDSEDLLRMILVERPSRRAGRKGRTRNIPDFEPIHLEDDAFSSRSQR